MYSLAKDLLSLKIQVSISDNAIKVFNDEYKFNTEFGVFVLNGVAYNRQEVIERAKEQLASLDVKGFTLRDYKAFAKRLLAIKDLHQNVNNRPYEDVYLLNEDQDYELFIAVRLYGGQFYKSATLYFVPVYTPDGKKEWAQVELVREEMVVGVSGYPSVSANTRNVVTGLDPVGVQFKLSKLTRSKDETLAQLFKMD